MKNRPIHENLDTSFVNLSALVRYLRRRQFVGNVRVELSGYEADINLTAENQIKVREHDRIAGRIAEGEEALQRLLIRAREPGGIINVYQEIAENEFNKKLEIKAEKPIQNTAVTQKIVSENRPQIIQPTATIKMPSAPQNIAETPKPKIETGVKVHEAKTSVKLPDFPFELSNKFESKAKQTQISSQDWQMLLNLTGELLAAIDECLASGSLNFAAAFQKSCAEVSGDYPFLNPNAGTFAYQKSGIKIQEQINAKIFAAGINESLRRILEKLGANPKFAETNRITNQKILALIHHRKPLYDKFSITPQLEKNLGI
jgi:hypothetical protein